MDSPNPSTSNAAPLRLFFSVGDVSADLHAANLIREIRKRRPDAVIEGLGGPRMAEAGCALLDELTAHNVMWFSNVARVLFKLRRIQNDALAHIAATRPDAVVMLDYSGFNLFFARRIAKTRVPVVYYISPAVWAWRAGRIRKIKKRVAKMLCIFPFEEEIYKKAGVPVEYVGNPLFDHLAGVTLDEEFRRSLREGDPDPLVGVLPGSRRQEVRDLLPVMADASELIRLELPKAAFVVAVPDEGLAELSRAILAKHGSGARVVVGRTFEVMAESDFCLAKSGTATLELAHFGTPMVILYRLNVPGYVLSALFRRSKFFGMPNILLGREAVPERLLWHSDPARLATLALDILKSPARQEAMRRELAELRDAVDRPGASARAAEAVLRFVEGRGAGAR